MRGMKLSAVGECADETKRRRRRRVVKFGALGDGGQWNYAPTEKTQSDTTFFLNFTKLVSECA